MRFSSFVFGTTPGVLDGFWVRYEANRAEDALGGYVEWNRSAHDGESRLNRLSLARPRPGRAGVRPALLLLGAWKWKYRSVACHPVVSVAMTDSQYSWPAAHGTCRPIAFRDDRQGLIANVEAGLHGVE